MKRWTLAILTGLVMTLVSTTLLQAQNGAAEPIPVTIGDITGGATEYYGQTVTFQANIREFVSTNTFVLTDGNTSVLVVNNSGYALPNAFVKGQDIIVAGRVQPSFSEVFNNATLRPTSFYEERTGMMGAVSDAMMATPDTMMATPDAMMATPDAMMTPNAMENMLRSYDEDLLAWLYNEALPDEFDGYTVIEVTDISALSYLPVLQ